MEYANELTSDNTNPLNLDQTKRDLPPKLNSRNLIVNKSKTKEYKIVQNGDEEWKNCKLLASLLETENDIDWKKGFDRSY